MATGLDQVVGVDLTEFEMQGREWARQRDEAARKITNYLEANKDNCGRCEKPLGEDRVYGSQQKGVFGSGPRPSYCSETCRDLYTEK